jgi:hypothetical protein
MIKYVILYQPENLPLKEVADNKLVATVSDKIKTIALWDSYDEAESARIDKTRHKYHLNDLRVIAVEVPKNY